nr:uncharacterized protein LOC127341881 isoform X2 [Lolium perenne]
MDLDDDDFELPARTCPPVGSRNTGKNKPEEDLHNHCCTDKRPLKKRKTITKMAQNRDAKIKQIVICPSYFSLVRLRCQFLHPLHHATMTLIQISKVTGIAEVGDTEDNSPEVTNEIIDGDANSTNSNSDNDEAEEVVSNRRIQRVGVVGRSFKRRRIRE